MNPFRLLGNVQPHLVWAVCYRNLLTYSHSWWTNLLPNFFDPIFYLLGMGLGLGAMVHGDVQGHSYLAFLAPGLMASAAMNGTSFESSYNMFVKMHFSKLFDAYLTTPASVDDIVVGELAWGITRAFIYGFAFFLVLCGFQLFGWKFLDFPKCLIAITAPLFVGFLFATIGQLFTSYCKNIEWYSFYWTLFLTPLFLFSDIFFPLSNIPHGHTIAWFTPLYHCVRLCRSFCFGQFGQAELVSITWILVVGLICHRLGLRQFRKRLVS